MVGKGDDGDCHQSLVGHRVNDGANNSLLIIVSCDIAVNGICNTGIREKREGVDRLRGEDEVAN